MCLCNTDEDDHFYIRLMGSAKRVRIKSDGMGIDTKSLSSIDLNDWTYTCSVNQYSTNDQDNIDVLIDVSILPYCHLLTQIDIYYNVLHYW